MIFLSPPSSIKKTRAPALSFACLNWAFCRFFLRVGTDRQNLENKHCSFLVPLLKGNEIEAGRVIQHKAGEGWENPSNLSPVYAPMFNKLHTCDFQGRRGRRGNGLFLLISIYFLAFHYYSFRFLFVFPHLCSSKPNQPPIFKNFLFHSQWVHVFLFLMSSSSVFLTWVLFAPEFPKSLSLSLSLSLIYLRFLLRAH